MAARPLAGGDPSSKTPRPASWLLTGHRLKSGSSLSRPDDDEAAASTKKKMEVTLGWKSQTSQACHVPLDSCSTLRSRSPVRLSVLVMYVRSATSSRRQLTRFDPQPPPPLCGLNSKSWLASECHVVRPHVPRTKVGRSGSDWKMGVRPGRGVGDLGWGRTEAIAGCKSLTSSPSSQWNEPGCLAGGLPF